MFITGACLNTLQNLSFEHSPQAQYLNRLLRAFRLPNNETPPFSAAALENGTTLEVEFMPRTWAGGNTANAHCSRSSLCKASTSNCVSVHLALSSATPKPFESQSTSHCSFRGDKSLVATTKHESQVLRATYRRSLRARTARLIRQMQSTFRASLPSVFDDRRSPPRTKSSR